MGNNSAVSQKPKHSTVSFLIFLCAAIFIFGCNESLQTGSGGGISAAVVSRAWQIVQDGLADDNPRVRANAIEIVAETQRIEFADEIEKLLKDDFVPVRFAAILAVGDMGYQPAKKTVKQLLADSDENTKIAAAYAMNKFGSSEAFGLLGKAISSKDQTVRANAVVLLGKSGNKNALGPLRWALRDEGSDIKVKLLVAEALAMLGDEQILKQKLWAMIYSTYTEDKIIGIRAIGALGTRQAKEILITKLDDEILEVRLAAAGQLGKLGDKTAEPEVLEVFEKNLIATLEPDRRQQARRLTALAIGHIGTKRLSRFLPELLKNDSKFVRLAAAGAVFQCSKKD